jgi:hypothetical protein
LVLRTGNKASASSGAYKVAEARERLLAACSLANARFSASMRSSSVSSLVRRTREAEATLAERVFVDNFGEAATVSCFFCFWAEGGAMADLRSADVQLRAQQRRGGDG